MRALDQIQPLVAADVRRLKSLRANRNEPPHVGCYKLLGFPPYPDSPSRERESAPLNPPDHDS